MAGVWQAHMMMRVPIRIIFLHPPSEAALLIDVITLAESLINGTIKYFEAFVEIGEWGL